MADYAIHDTTLIGTSNVIRKKEGSSALIDPADYPKRINLMGMLEEKTQASAPVCSFSDGTDDVPTKSLVVTIPPTLSGVFSVTETQTGGNIIELYTRSSHNGIDYSINADGSLHRSGTATGNSFNNSNATNYNNCPYKFHAGTYTLSVDGNINNNTFVSLGIFLKSGASFTSQCVTGVGSVTFTVSEDFGAWYYCKLNNGVTVNDDVYIWLYAGSTAHAYEPYTAPTTHTASLGRTIYGGTADIVNGIGTEEYANTSLTDKNYYYSSSLQRFDCALDGVISSGYMDDFIPPQGYTINHALIIDAVNAPDYTMCIYGGKLYIKNISCSSVSELVIDMSGKYITYSLATQTDFTFDGQEVPTRLGYNAFWSDSGDTEVTYRSSGTITPVPVVPTLISKTITENGTYDAEDDDADGYSSVTVNVEGVPSGYHDDPLDIMSDYSRANIQNLYSCLYVESGSLKNEIVFQLASATGYEGFCINLDKYNLESGKTYNLSFVLDVPTTVSFSGSYPWGIKYSATRIPASGSASTNTFNITPTVNFLEQTGSQNVSMQFEASSSNYLVVLLARVSGNRTEWIKMKDFNIQEVLS